MFGFMMMWQSDILIVIQTRNVAVQHKYCNVPFVVPLAVQAVDRRRHNKR